MNRTLLSSISTASRTAARQQTRRYATGPAASNASSNLATIFLGLGVASAGGYYYLSRTSPETIKKAENAVEKATGVPLATNASAGAGGAVTSSDPSKSALDPSKFVNFKLKEVKPYNHNASVFSFELPEGTESGLTVASALLMKPTIEGQGLDSKGKPAIRPYTPITQPNTKGHMDFLIKKYDGGAFTTHLFDLKPGQEIAFKGPLPKHQWKANEFEEIGLVLGGTAITPGYQLMQAIDANPQDKTKVTLLFANVTEKDILLKEEFERLSKSKPEQFKIVHVIEKPEGRGYAGEKGYIGRELLAKYLPMPGKADKIKLFVCGPPPMVEAISGNKVSPKDQGPLKGALSDLGYQPSQVYKF